MLASLTTFQARFPLPSHLSFKIYLLGKSLDGAVGSLLDPRVSCNGGLSRAWTLLAPSSVVAVTSKRPALAFRIPAERSAQN
nr:hypothetical protein CFP56_11741 [Quercus suber]